MYVNLHKAAGAALWLIFAAFLGIFGYKTGKKRQQKRCKHCN